MNFNSICRRLVAGSRIAILAAFAPCAAVAARIEVPPGDIPRLAARAAEIAAAFKDLGFAYVTLDLFGYRTGSMNEVLHGKH